MVYVAILGFGTVGAGVAKVIEKNAATIQKRAREVIEVKYILDIRDFPDSPYQDKLIKDFSVIENDPAVQVVVETIGGATIAYEFTKRALLAGKSVVTSNKELVAEHGAELLHMARERNLNYLFEASVGGGIPIIRPISQCLAANELDEVCGILNGTTNYILSNMIRGGLSFDAALEQARRKGYAEANPSADVDGHDACRKICILGSLAFGRHIYPRQVQTEGIAGVTLRDAAYADAAGYAVKLLGRAKRMPDGLICAYVGPHLVEKGTPLAGVEDVFNGIMVRGDVIGDVMFYGRGAGQMPTASAVVADVIDAAKHAHARKYLYWEEGGDIVAPPESMHSAWYVRAACDAGSVEAAFGRVCYIEDEAEKTQELAFLTCVMGGAEFQRAKNSLSGVRCAMRVL